MVNKFSVGEFRKLCNIDANMHSHTYQRFTYSTKHQNMVSDLSSGVNMVFDRIYVMLAPAVIILKNDAGSVSFYHVKEIYIDNESHDDGNEITIYCDNTLCDGNIMEYTLIAK